MTKTLNVVFLAVGAVVLVLVGVGHPRLEFLGFHDQAPQRVWDALTSLFLVALTFERALEVLVATFREPGAIPLRREVERVQERLDLVPRDARLEAAAKLVAEESLAKEQATARARLDAYRSATQAASLATSLFGAILVSAVGFRVLATLVASTPPPGTLQGGSFAIIDVLVTGGLIAGGSKGIHSLTQAVGDVLDAARQRAGEK